MPWPGTGFGVDLAGRARRQAVGAGVEFPLRDDVLGEDRRIAIAIIRIDEDAMSLGPVRNDLRRLLDDMAVAVDRVDRQLGGAEQMPPGPVGDDIGHAVLQRRGREMGQPAARRVDRKARHRKAVAAQRRVEKPMVGRHCHRHAGGRRCVDARAPGPCRGDQGPRSPGSSPGHRSPWFRRSRRRQPYPACCHLIPVAAAGPRALPAVRRHS